MILDLNQMFYSVKFCTIFFIVRFLGQNQTGKNGPICKFTNRLKPDVRSYLLLTIFSTVLLYVNDPMLNFCHVFVL